MSQVMRTLAGNPAIRASLPLGVDIADATAMRPDIALITAALLDAIEHPDLDQLSEAMLQDARRNQRAAPLGPLRQLHDAEAITDGSAIHSKRHVVASIDTLGPAWRYVVEPATSPSGRPMWHRSRRC